MKKILGLCLAAVMVFGVLTACNNTPIKSDGKTAGKVVVNIEGTVTSVDGSKITLDNGKRVTVSPDTIFAGDPDTNIVVSKNIVVGNFIQGYTKDDADSEQVSADKIYCNSPVRTGSKLLINFEGEIVSVEDGSITLKSGQKITFSDDTVFSVASGIVKNVVLSEEDKIQGHLSDDGIASRIHLIY